MKPTGVMNLNCYVDADFAEFWGQEDVASSGENPQTHSYFRDELLLVKFNFVGPLVDTADDRVACTSSWCENDTHSSFITI